MSAKERVSVTDPSCVQLDGDMLSEDSSVDVVSGPVFSTLASAPPSADTASMQLLSLGPFPFFLPSLLFFSPSLVDL